MLGLRRKRTAHALDLAVAFIGAATVDDVRMRRVIHIARVPDATDGNLSLSAELLGMHRRSLQRYIRRRQRPRARRAPPKTNRHR